MRAVKLAVAVVMNPDIAHWLDDLADVQDVTAEDLLPSSGDDLIAA